MIVPNAEAHNCMPATPITRHKKSSGTLFPETTGKGGGVVQCTTTRWRPLISTKRNAQSIQQLCTRTYLKNCLVKICCCCYCNVQRSFTQMYTSVVLFNKTARNLVPDKVQWPPTATEWNKVLYVGLGETMGTCQMSAWQSITLSLYVIKLS